MLNSKNDCFAIIHEGKHTKCDCLREKDCSNCKFYKTKKEYDEKVAPLEYKVKEIVGRK